MDKIKKLFILIVLLAPFISFGQQVNSTQRGGPENIYNNALKHYITGVIKKDNLQIDTLLIQRNKAFSDSLQGNISGIFLQTIDWAEINSRLEKEESIVVYRVSPLQIDKGQFVVSITPLVTTKSNDGIDMANTGSCNIVYSFNSKLKKFEFLNISCFGF